EARRAVPGETRGQVEGTVACGIALCATTPGVAGRPGADLLRQLVRHHVLRLAGDRGGQRVRHSSRRLRVAVDTAGSGHVHRGNDGSAPGFEGRADTAAVARFGVRVGRTATAGGVHA